MAMATTVKKLKLEPGQLDEHSSHFLNWDLCMLCQKQTNVKLQCPNNSKRGDAGAGYMTFVTNFKAFQTADAVPEWVKCKFDDESDDNIVEKLRCNNAKWHKSCRDLLNATKLQRVERKVSRMQVDSETEGLSGECDVLNTSCSTRSSFSAVSDAEVSRCFFCEKPGQVNDELHAVQTKNVDNRVRHCAHSLLDERLIAKLSAGDMVAIEAKYHARCLAGLYNKMRDDETTDANSETSDRKTHDSEGEVAASFNARMHSVAFAQLVAHIEEVKCDAVTLPIFRLSKLAELYASRLTELGVQVNSRINTTKLKNRLLAYFPEMRAQQSGKHVVLAFDEHIGTALSVAYQQRFDEDALCLAKAASIVRCDLFTSDTGFTGEFTDRCQEHSVPSNLLLLIKMIMEGPSIEDQSIETTKQAALSVAQIVKYNSVKHVRQGSVGHVRHSVSQETPLPLYISLLLHGTERSRSLIDKLFSLGLCISYDRLLQVSTALGNSVSDTFNLTCGPCPPGLCVGMFTTAAVDNIDHNPSSNTSLDSFHGTAVSLTQHRSCESEGVTLSRGNFEISGSKSLKPLPSSYTSVLPTTLKSKHPPVPAVDFQLHTSLNATARNLSGEEGWLDNVQSTLTDGCGSNSNMSWAAFHASQNSHVSYNFTNSRMLPLFRDAAHSVAMIRHAMNVVKNATDHLNPGQVPVLTLDQPLFAIAKRIQWNWPDVYGENKLVILLGGLHIEMAALKVVGDWLCGSGWTAVLVQSGVVTSGVADSLLRAAHVKRTRHMHEVTVASLYVLQRRAYAIYLSGLSDSHDKLDYNAWCTDMSAKHPQFQYWDMTMQLQLLLLQLIRSIRLANFDLYVSSLTRLAPWFFAMDHSNYARWVSVHLRDMHTLSTMNPDIAAEFRLGKFVVNKTQRAFSAIALDQTHEQLNALVKGNGGAIGLTENPAALLRWMVSGPEIANLISQFDHILGSDEKTVHFHHHEQTVTFQSNFEQQVNAVVATFIDKGNPFSDTGLDLYSLETMVVVDRSVAGNLNNIVTTALSQFNSFVNECLVTQAKSIEDPISRNHLAPFRQSRGPVKKDTKLSVVKSDRELFSRLYIGCQNRGADLDDFFRHENHAFPPSLSDNGQLRLGKKSDLLQCLENESVTTSTIPAVECVILDGAAIVQMLNPGKCKTFLDYACNVFVPHIESQLFMVHRLDLVWDQYRADSLKCATRAKRGTGYRQRVVPTSAIPTSWQDFLRVDENKVELFSFLSNHVIHHFSGHSVEERTLEPSQATTSLVCPEISSLMPCTQEEADTRMFLHVLHAAKCGVKRAMIRTVDTDVVVLAISTFMSLSLDELWIAFGVGTKFRYIAVHKIVSTLGSDRCKALPIFHSLTGCDTTSSFLGHGKKGAWETWNLFPDVTSTFIQLCCKPDTDAITKHMPAVERFVILMYDRTSHKDSVDSIRKHLFTKNSRQIENLPPSQAALTEHVKRATLQAGHCWASALDVAPVIPCPSKWGWQKVGDKWEPKWSTLAPVSNCCPQLVSCQCKKGCTKRCKCHKACLPCTALCYCDGTCRD